MKWLNRKVKVMSNVSVINNIGKDVNVTVNGTSDKIEIVIDLANNNFNIPSNLKIGDTFKDTDGDEWILLYYLPNGDAAILSKNSIKEMKFGSNNNYNGCDIDKYLSNTYLKELKRKFGKDNIVGHEVDLLSLDGENDYGVIKRRVSIPTVDIYRHNKKAIKKYIDKLFWLATPNSTTSGYSPNYVHCVNSCGGVGYSWWDECGAVRPFVILKDSVFRK
jgi:hypothetical protein